MDREESRVNEEGRGMCVWGWRQNGHVKTLEKVFRFDGEPTSARKWAEWVFSGCCDLGQKPCHHVTAAAEFLSQSMTISGTIHLVFIAEHRLYKIEEGLEYWFSVGRWRLFWHHCCWFLMNIDCFSCFNHDLFRKRKGFPAHACTFSLSVFYTHKQQHTSEMQIVKWHVWYYLWFQLVLKSFFKVLLAAHVVSGMSAVRSTSPNHHTELSVPL